MANKYQIYCITEAEWKYVLSEEPPTVCPTDNAHTVNPTSVASVGEVTNIATTIKEPTAGRFRVEMFQFPIASGTPGATVTNDLTFDIEIYLWTSGFNCLAGMVGDRFDLILNPDNYVGNITELELIGSTVLSVSAGVIANVTPGMYVTLVDDIILFPITQDLGKVLEVDADASTITVSNPLSTLFSLGSKVLANIYMEKNVILDRAGTISLSEKGFGGTIIPAGSIVRMNYVNTDGASKTLNRKVGYYGADFSL